MLETLHADSFKAHLQTKFLVADGFVLELVEVFEPPATPRQERFSLTFVGPSEPVFQQGTYALQHEVIGTLNLFLVPIGKDGRGVQYEAVFNRWLAASKS